MHRIYIAETNERFFMESFLLDTLHEKVIYGNIYFQ